MKIEGGLAISAAIILLSRERALMSNMAFTGGSPIGRYIAGKAVESLTYPLTTHSLSPGLSKWAQSQQHTAIVWVL